MNCAKLRSIAALSSVAVLSTSFTVELWMTNPHLSLAEMRTVTGGVTATACEPSKMMFGYRCSNFRSLPCDIICSPCYEESDNENICRLTKCWQCSVADPQTPKIKECRIGDEDENCITFGHGPEYGVCGNIQDDWCSWHTADERCFCQPPLYDTGLSCPRKDCEDFTQ